MIHLKKVWDVYIMVSFKAIFANKLQRLAVIIFQVQSTAPSFLQDAF